MTASRAVEARYIAAGTCSRGCGRPLVNARYCAVCRRRLNDTRRALSERKRAAGKCVRSGCSNPVEAGRATCEPHLRDSRVKQTAQRARLRAARICIVSGCGEPTAAKSKSLCAHHLAEHRDRQAAFYQERKSAGVCRQCGGALAPESRTRCRKHLALLRPYFADRKAKRAAA